MDHDFNIGDRVVMVDRDRSDKIRLLVNGSVGTVRKFAASSRGDVGVEWDDNIGGHTLGGNVRDGHGWWVYAESLEHECEDEDDGLSGAVSDEDLLAFIGF